MNENKMLTVSEVAQYLKVSKITVYKMIKNHKLDFIRINERSLRISKEKLDKCIADATN